MASYGSPASLRAFVVASFASSGYVGPSAPSGWRGREVKGVETTLREEVKEGEGPQGGIKIIIGSRIAHPITPTCCP